MKYAVFVNKSSRNIPRPARRGTKAVELCASDALFNHIALSS